MATHRVRLVNGPCNGQVKTISQAAWDNGATTCKGATYVYDGVIRPTGQLPHFTYRPGAPPPPTGSPDEYAPHATKAWGALQAQFNRTMPTTLRRVGRLQVATSTALRRHRRVRR